MDATQIILIVLIVLLIIIYPILVSARNKKENQRMLEQTNSLKRGDKILTHSGIYGTIVDLQLDGDRKIVTLETGNKDKGYISIDAYAIYSVIKDEEVKKDDVSSQTNVEQVEENKKENDKTETLAEEKTEENVKEEAIQEVQDNKTDGSIKDIEEQIHGKKKSKRN